MPTVKYTVYINDALGNRLIAPKDWVSVDYMRVENGIGRLKIVLPGYYPRSLLKKDGVLELWRSVDGGLPYLDTETVWLQRAWKKIIRGGIRTWEIRCQCLNRLLNNYVVDYASDTANASKTQAADDMGKQIVRDNQNTVRNASIALSTYLDVQANLTAAPSIAKAFSERKVLTILQELAQASFQKGTYLVFDTVCSVPPGSGSAMKFELRSYTGQRGVDHRFPGGNPPVLLGPDFHNMDEVEYEDNAEDEITRVIAGGQGVGTARTFTRSDDTTRQGESPFNFIEGFLNAYNAITVSPQNESDNAVKQGRPMKTLVGKIIPTSGLIYGTHFKWGDFLTAQIDGDSFDCHLDRVHVTYTRDEHEKIDAYVRGSA